MGASDDEDELAELRMARAARTGAAGMSLATLRAQQQQQQRAEEAEALSLRPESRGIQQGAAHSGSLPNQDPAHAADAPGETQEDELSKYNLPTSFGEKPKPSTTAAVLQSFHAQTRRAPSGPSSTSFGPPRPPPRPGVGPPRPPTATGSAPTVAAGDEQGGDVGPLPPPVSDAAGGQETGDEDEPIGPPAPPADADGDLEGAETGGGADELGPFEDPYSLPITHEVVLGSAQARGLTCLDVDHTGSRLITGSMDCTLRIYDFNGMKRDMKAFRELEPQEGHPVLSVSWSPTGDAFLVVTGASQAKIYDRDGRSLGEFVRGDMYIRDMRNTKGHVSGLMGGCWHPHDRFTAMTCSEDGTVRVWDTHNIMQKTVVKPTLARPGRVAVTACAYGLEGRLLGAGLMDGSIQLWNVSGKFGASAAVGQVLPPAPQMVEKQNWTYVSRSTQLVRGAHEAGTEITCLTFSQDGNTLVSRSVDATLKLWDLRKFKDPVHVWAGLPCAYATSNAIFSPDEQLILTGVSSGTGHEDGGSVVVVDKARGEIVRRISVPTSASVVCWHHRLNQIIVGTGNRKTGGCRVLYDPELSQRGVLYGAARAPRKPSPFDMTPEMLARAAYDEPIRKFQRMTGKKRREQMAQDAVKHHKPDPGMAAGKGKQGRIGTSTKTLLTQHMLNMKGGLKAPDLDLDPREAILRHADKVDAFSVFTNAYKATQPTPIFAQEEEEEEGSEGAEAGAS